MKRDMNWILCSAWKRWIGGTPSEQPPYSPSPAPCDFWAFPTMIRELRVKKISKWWTVCSTFSRSGWSVVRSATLAKRGTSKKRPSSHLHKVPTRNNKVSPRTFQVAHVKWLEEDMQRLQWNFVIQTYGNINKLCNFCDQQVHFTRFDILKTSSL
jgi:hypothetical protein